MEPFSTASDRELLLPLDEVSHLVSTNGNPAETLSNITALIQMRFQVDVCSLYLLDPSRTTLMLDWAPSEFSRVRLQWANDRVRYGLVDNQFLIQYQMSLGAHGAHGF